MKNNIMTHLVAGYPSEKDSIEFMLEMDKLGVFAVEIQIPFSDPIADGTTIMRANDLAIESGMTLQKSFELVNKAREKGFKTDVYLMSYLQKLIHIGPEKFCRQASTAKASGLIIPDLPFDTEEYSNIKFSADKYNIQIAPVISPTMNEARLKMILSNKPKLIYLTSMKGITGKNLAVGDDLKNISAKVKKYSPKSQLAIGFGVRNRADVNEILKIADVAVIGSELIRLINSGGVKQALDLVKKLV